MARQPSPPGGIGAPDDAALAEAGVLRWGGLAGMVGGVLPIVFFALVSAFVPSSSSPAADFPAVRTATLVAETVYLAAIALWAVLVLALFRALRGDALRRLKRALIGSS